MSKLSKYFTWKEAACRDGTPVPDKLKTSVSAVAYDMDVIRDFFGVPITVNSWYRTPEYNKKVGGKPSSKHLLGIAVDFTVKGVSPKQVREVLEGLIRIGAIYQGGIGAYDRFTHYDNRGTKARW